MKELLEAIESCTELSELVYNPMSKIWTVFYLDGESAHMESDSLIEFLNNG